MKIKAHTERCISSGACVFEAPQLFTQDDDGFVVVRVIEPEERDYAAARSAAAACPAAVIELDETADE
jgi:ferredoxin